jgi:uncharacterized protein (DUF433 family)
MKKWENFIGAELGEFGYTCGMIELSKCPAVESRPGKLSGAWVFRGTRVPVEALLANLSAGATVDEFLDWFEGVSREQVTGFLDFLAHETRASLRLEAEAASA